MQLGQRQPRLGALFLDQAAARLPVETECVTGPAAPVQGGHLVGDERLIQRVGDQQVVQFADQVGVPAERELTLDPLQNGRPALLFETVPHPGHPAAVDARESLAAPHPVRLAQQRGRLVLVAVSGSGIRLPPQLPELVQVDRLGIDVEQVAPGPPGQLDAVADGLPERTTEPGYVRGQALPRLGRRPGIPQPVNEGVGRHGGSGRQQEDGEHATFPGRPKIVLPVSRPKLNRPEDPKFHDRLASSTACGLLTAGRMEPRNYYFGVNAPPWPSHTRIGGRGNGKRKCSSAGQPRCGAICIEPFMESAAGRQLTPVARQ